MDTDALTPSLLRALRAPQPYPAVSLTMPTHRRQPDNAQDAVRLRNLVAEAGRRLDADPDVSRQAGIDVRAHLDRAVAEVGPWHALDGLLIFASPAESHVWTLAREVPERVVLSDTFLTRNLVAAKAQARPFWVLAVSGDRATLWSGTREGVREEEREGFPMTVPETQFDAQREERIGDVPSTFQDEETRHFLRAADEALGAVLAADSRPLYLIGLPQALTALEEVGVHCRSAAGTVHKGGLTDASPTGLLKELRPAIEEHRRREATDIAGRLDDARGRRSFAAGLDEVWAAVRDRRAGVVAVEEHFRQTVRVTDRHLEPVGADARGSAVTSPQVRDDIVDELVEAALDSGADVAFLADDALAEHGRISAGLRY